jgi:hypothetical protein
VLDKSRLIRVFLCLVLLFSFSASAAVITINAGGKTTTVESSPLNITISETGQAVFASEDIQYLSKTGEPQIPWKVMRVLLPPNADLSTVSANIISAEYETVAGECDVTAAPPILTWDNDGNVIEIWPKDKTTVDGRDTDIYSADAFWPDESVTLVGKGKLRGWRLAEIAVPLVVYNPASGELLQLLQAEISVDCQKKGKGDAGKGRGRGRVKKLAVNFDEAVGVYEAAAGGKKNEPESGPASDGDILPLSPTGTSGYVIITTNAIRASSTKLSNFVTHKENMGFTVTVIDEDDTGATVVGDAAATKLREWLQANYISMDLKYALIIGDPQPANDYVPMKMYPCDGRDIPTDYFYAELTCDWDSNHNGIIGESGEIERYFEVYVGRIPHYGVMADTDAILQKTIDYENATDTQWRRNTLISNVPLDSSMHGYNWGEQVKHDLLEPRAISSDRAYRDGYGHTVTDYDIVPPPEFPASAYPATVWSQGQYGLHVWSTHGWAKGASGIASSGDTPSLNDNYPSTVFQGSCDNAYPEFTDNLSYSILKNGGIVTLGATRLSYYMYQTDFSNTPTDCGMSYRYAKGIAEGKSCGEALWDLKEEISSWWTHNWTLFNPYGDPSVVVMPEAPDFLVKPTDRFYTKQYDGATVVLTNRTYTLENNGSSALNWTASKTASWFDISPDSGSIPAGGSVTVDVTLNSGIESLALGTHTDTITFTDTTNSVTVLRDVEYVFEIARISQSGWTLQYVDSEETTEEDTPAIYAFDGNTGSIWHTEWSSSDPPHPHEIQIDLGHSYDVRGFAYLPRQNNENGRIANYEFYVSEDGVDWGLAAVATGTFDNTTAEQDVFITEVSARYIRLVALSEVNGNAWTSVAELNVYYTPLSLIPQSGWTLHYVDSKETSAEDGAAENTFDGDKATIWHTQYTGSTPSHPHEIQINLGDSYGIQEFKYLPRQSGENGRIANYEFYVSTDGSSWGSAVATGTFVNTADEQEVFFDNVIASYVRLVALSEVNGNRWTSVAELNVYSSSEAEDTTAPTPDPMTWATVPYATGTFSIAMVAATASDPSSVKYYFTCTAGGGNDSGWQDTTTYEDTGLAPNTTYTYTVKARDESNSQNETASSTEASATNQLPADIDGNGSIGPEDLALMAARWQNSPCAGDDWCSMTDLNLSDKVDMFDLSILAGSWRYVCMPVSCYVESIVPSTASGTLGREKCRATVVIYDDCGNSVADATVTGTFTGPFIEQVIEVTDSDGVAVLTTTGQVTDPSFTFCVDEVTHSELTYEPTDNIETCDSY